SCGRENVHQRHQPSWPWLQVERSASRLERAIVQLLSRQSASIQVPAPGFLLSFRKAGFELLECLRSATPLHETTREEQACRFSGCVPNHPPCIELRLLPSGKLSQCTGALGTQRRLDAEWRLLVER